MVTETSGTKKMYVATLLASPEMSRRSHSTQASVVPISPVYQKAAANRHDQVICQPSSGSPIASSTAAPTLNAPATAHHAPSRGTAGLNATVPIAHASAAPTA